MEFWTVGRIRPHTIREQAASAEEAGWDGLLMADSQNRAGDTYVALAAAATATSRLKLGTGVTNPVTRHPAVTASAIATLDQISGGRAMLGLGRGDSALAHIDLAPATVARFKQYVRNVQAYLRGEAVRFDELDSHGHRRLEEAGVQQQLDHSRLVWMDRSRPKVPVEIVGSGEKVLRIGAVFGDRVSVNVGAQPERIRWAIDVVRSARVAEGLPAAGLPIGAYLNVVVHPDREIARRLAGVGTATLSRIFTMHGVVQGPVDQRVGAELSRLVASYDTRSHAVVGAAHGSTLSPAAVESLAITGPPEDCVDRLRELADLGIDRVQILATIAEDGPDLELSRRLLVDEVMPALQS